ncbi:peptidoglycan-binding domain-containing protein [Streptomyces glaucosporus]|uniref:peptidoglycan-binding domain-containing protein n=1 Tax=Streptomyces glaucosporus TaxID=284044 RepID=UPI0031CDCF9F
MAQPDGGPDPADLAMFEGASDEAGRPDEDTSPLPVVEERPPRRRARRGLLVAVGGTALAAVGSAALIAGVFAQGDDPFDEARFEDRGGAPTLLLPTADTGESARPGPGATASPSSSAPASASASASPSRSGSPSPSASAGSPSASSSGKADPRPSSSGLPGQDGRDGRDGWGGRGDGDREDGGGRSSVLREGDTGPEVVELQYRLAARGVYRGEPDGRYDDGVREAVATFQVWHGVHGDPEGVYGPNTRRELERATQGRGGR